MIPTALLIIDIQFDYFPGGNMELEGALEAGERAGRLLNWFRNNGQPRFHIQHIASRPGATFFLPNTFGAGIHDCVQPIPGETVIHKHYPNSFRQTNLLEQLQVAGIQRLVIAGMMTHMCVDATTRAATDYGYPCLIAADACATRTLVLEGQTVSAGCVQTAFLAALNGSYGRVQSVEDILRGLSSEIQKD